MQDMANKANLPDLAVFATLVMCAQGFVGYPVASLCLKSEAKRIKAQIDAGTPRWTPVPPRPRTPPLPARS